MAERLSKEIAKTLIRTGKDWELVVKKLEVAFFGKNLTLELLNLFEGAFRGRNKVVRVRWRYT